MPAQTFTTIWLCAASRKIALGVPARYEMKVRCENVGNFPGRSTASIAPMKLFRPCIARKQDRDGLEVRSGPRDRRIPGPNRDSNEERQCKRVWCTLNPTGPNKCPLAGVAWKFGEAVPAQVSSSSSDYGS
ncbi:hypothetical protein AVEN_178838-1 [Araneus ventricosus]|uniref:Uncharacterized protein n=1 Tax=Araneus ventricosus TaxID=182803 RepID=A0A4Y2BF85_ARAVE|nr:hypothetical protein AVEN_178838-1 [Araneus ventricosus]